LHQVGNYCMVSVVKWRGVGVHLLGTSAWQNQRIRTNTTPSLR